MPEQPERVGNQVLYAEMIRNIILAQSGGQGGWILLAEAGA